MTTPPTPATRPESLPEGQEEICQLADLLQKHGFEVFTDAQTSPDHLGGYTAALLLKAASALLSERARASAAVAEAERERRGRGEAEERARDYWALYQDGTREFSNALKDAELALAQLGCRRWNGNWVRWYCHDCQVISKPEPDETDHPNCDECDRMTVPLPILPAPGGDKGER